MLLQNSLIEQLAEKLLKFLEAWNVISYKIHILFHLFAS